MAGFQPTQDAVDMFLEMVGPQSMTRDIAIRRLMGNNNNVEQAINEYFENPSAEAKYKWDESQFSSDRDGGGNNHGIAFNIQGADDLGPHARGPYEGAMSRPPSRTSNNKSPLGKITDLTAEHAMAKASMSMSTQDQQDRELQQALAMSLADAGLPPQEEGVTGTDEVAFGPANRNEYEQGKWEMVPVGKTSVQEIVVDPEPTERKRDLDAPAFLKPTVANSRLNALITIYHEIPLIRNVFLNITDCLPNYGNDREWWAGQRITLPMMHADDDLPTYDEVDRELQRLMAFLDKTDRSYGSVDVLANLDEVKRLLRQQAPDLESAVLYAWKNIFDNSVHPNWTKVIFSAGVPSAAAEDRPQEFAMLELTPPPKDSAQETLYDIADEALWPGLGNLDLAEAPYLSHIAEVVAFRIEGGAEHKRVEIPAVWYPDRYLKSSREAALDMRKKKRATVDKFQRICKLEEQLTYVPLRSGKIVAVKVLFNASLKHDENEIQESGVTDEDDVMDADPRPSKAAARLSDELRKVVESIDKKLTTLVEAKEKACEELRNLSKLYTEPSDDPSAPQLRKYSLRGVSTSKHTMYICRRAEPDLMELDLENDGPATNGDQWWRIHYAPVGMSPVNVEKTTEEKVLDAAKNESNNTILIYASEKALNFPKHALPKSLDNFVRYDNAAFKSEFPPSFSDIDAQSPTHTSTEDSQSVSSSQLGPSSPGKRKYEEDEILGRPVTRRATISISEREVRSSDESESSVDSAGTVTRGSHSMGVGGRGEADGDVLIGVDPSLLESSNPNTNGAGYQGNGNTNGKAREIEMQERDNMPMLGGRPMVGGTGAVAATRAMSDGLGMGVGTIDSMDMDLDQVVQRDENVREESAASKAVRKVGFSG